MAAGTSDPKQRFSDYLTFLRKCAEQVVVQGVPLTGLQEDERETKFRDFADLGDSMKLTERDMVVLMFEGLFHQGPKCRCAECRVRGEMER